MTERQERRLLEKENLLVNRKTPSPVDIPPPMPYKRDRRIQGI